MSDFGSFVGAAKTHPAKRNREDDDHDHDHGHNHDHDHAERQHLAQLQHHIEAANAAIVALLDAGEQVSRSQLEAVRKALLGTRYQAHPRLYQ